MTEPGAFESWNPATEERFGVFAPTPAAEIDRALALATEAATRNPRQSVAERVKPLARLGDLLHARRDALARQMALEMGKPLGEGVAEIDKCAALCEWVVERAEDALAPQPFPPIPERAYLWSAPLGPLLAIMPWNFPFWQVLRCLAPSVAAGNPVLLKHAPNVFGCAEELSSLVEAAGFPTGTFTSLRLDVATTESLIARPEIAAVTLTGSTAAGRKVAAACGRALKPSVLELGGSDPALILADADLDHAAQECVTSRLINGGQSCIAAKRWIVVEDVAESFIERAVAAMASRRVGAPLDDPEIDLGPLARRDLRENLERQVTASLAGGATVRFRGEGVPRRGWFFPPTLLTDVTPDQAVFREETFGPVAAVSVARDEAQAIEWANQTSFGLGASVFTNDIARGERIVREELRVGSGFVNRFVRSDARVPFGGTRDSGWGRELGALGLRAFTNAKTIVVHDFGPASGGSR